MLHLSNISHLPCRYLCLSAVADNLKFRWAVTICHDYPRPFLVCKVLPCWWVSWKNGIKDRRIKDHRIRHQGSRIIRSVQNKSNKLNPYVAQISFTSHALSLLRFPCRSCRETENRQTSKFFILLKVIRSVEILCPLCLTVKKKHNSPLLVVRYFLFKKSRKAKNWFNSPMRVLEIFDLLLPCILQGTHNNNSVGRCKSYHFPNQLSNPVWTTTKTSSFKQVILQDHSICFFF